PLIAKLPLKSNSIGMQFKLLPGGVFTMGSDSGNSDESPTHQVTLTKPFEIGVYEVTQEQFQIVMGTNPSKFEGDKNPVEMVSRNAAVRFCQKLSAMPAEKVAGFVYRLPTEAEWEYACRAGSWTSYSFGNDESKLDDYAWYNKNSKNSTHPVGQKMPNDWGLYDMHGNVFEWCQDWYDNYFQRDVTDPMGPSEGGHWVRRGGSWNSNSDNCRSAFRGRSSLYSGKERDGFRVVRSSVK
ncbi:MAG: formylglycine-generating enzyme family protein, partial [Planctomycetaceae bacterium]|nr:formylglycine-generating enzyme family protein [Planctomycetaceae bacterium]